MPVQRVVASAVCLLVLLASLSTETLAATPPKRTVHHTVATAKRPTPHKTTVHHSTTKAATRSASKPGGKVPAKTASAVKDPNAFIQIYDKSRQAYQAGQYATAERLAKQSLSMVETVAGAKHKNVAIISHFTGIILSAQSKWPDAARYLKRALAIYNAPGNSTGNEDSIIYEEVTLGKIAIYQQQYDEAQHYLESALPLSQKHYGADHAETAAIQDMLNDLRHMDAMPDYLQAMGDKVTRWTDPATQPIVVYIGDGNNIPGWKPDDKALVRNAYLEWQQALNDHIRFEFTDNPEQADTLVSWMERPTPEDELSGGIGAHKELALGMCATLFRNNQWIRDNIVLSVNDTKGKPLTADSLHNVVLHEVAHSLGLVGGHSNHPADVLFPSTKYDGGLRKKPTQRDINTIAHLYSRLRKEPTHPAFIWPSLRG